MKNLFNSIKLTRPKSNMFDLSHDVKLSGKMGNLIPIMCTECVPGDKFNISCESLLRFQPMLAPVMHRMDVTIHYFFVPNRLVWEGFEDYITNTLTNGVLPAFPYIAWQTGYGPDSRKLADYFGVSVPLAAGNININAIPFAAYQMIYNEYYRDQNLQTEVPFQLVNGNNWQNDANLLALRKRAWEHDYFTSALPFAQKGNPVTLPIAGFEDVRVVQDVQGMTTDTTVNWESAHRPSGDPTTTNVDIENLGIQEDHLFAKTSEIDGGTTTINDLRRALRLQEWLEKAARGGSRYIENILTHFGVRSSDKRLQRPEYITGVKSPVVVSEVLNTTGTSTAPQGDMAGHAVSVVNGRKGFYSCEEHGYIIGIMSVLPKTAYQQGIPKHFLKVNDPFDFYWPSFAHIGEQEIKQAELYADPATQNETFGYVPRYSEYKFENNRVAGDFKTTLNYWHLGRIFANNPSLNSAFIQSDPTTRIFAVEDGTDQILAHIYNKVKAVRPMPKFGSPTL